ncbi:hypothetical protein Gogos_000366 [Gossypium gossypioides]|uniref:Uncharacterized protein n=1 Tax=Gossypium gossypioides TaxID=34282 RepID=A0A7J9CT75_GOSGO|nr:hypothetical protein [Gossypium gossypioides]
MHVNIPSPFAAEAMVCVEAARWAYSWVFQEYRLRVTLWL